MSRRFLLGICEKEGTVWWVPEKAVKDKGCGQAGFATRTVVSSRIWLNEIFSHIQSRGFSVGPSQDYLSQYSFSF